MTLAQTDVLVKAGEACAHVFFPDTFIASVISKMLDGRAVEVGTVGGEGMVGVDVFLGGRVSDYDIVAQIAGTGRRADVAVLAESAEEHPALRRLLNRSARAYLGQVAQTAAWAGKWGATGRDRDNVLITFTAPLSSVILAGTWTASSGKTGTFTMAKLP